MVMIAMLLWDWQEIHLLTWFKGFATGMLLVTVVGDLTFGKDVR